MNSTPSRYLACLALGLVCAGCYAEGNAYFLSTGDREYFLTMGRCESEAAARYTGGEPKYGAYECRSKLLWFTLAKRDYYEGKQTAGK